MSVERPSMVEQSALVKGKVDSEMAALRRAKRSNRETILVAQLKTRLRRMKGKDLTMFAGALVQELSSAEDADERTSGVELFKCLSLPTLEPDFFDTYKETLQAQQEKEDPQESLVGLLDIGNHLINIRTNNNKFPIPHDFSTTVEIAVTAIKGKPGEEEIQDKVIFIKNRLPHDEKLIYVSKLNEVRALILENPNLTLVAVSEQVKLPFDTIKKIRAELDATGATPFNYDQRTSKIEERILLQEEAIIMLVQKYPKMSNLAIARKLGMANTTAYDRLSALRKRNVIDDNNCFIESE